MGLRGGEEGAPGVNVVTFTQSRTGLLSKRLLKAEAEAGNEVDAEPDRAGGPEACALRKFEKG